ncbi:MAG: hypothetical protein ACI4JW_04275 [Oscillospiraceae bacterium]
MSSNGTYGESKIQSIEKRLIRLEKRQFGSPTLIKELAGKDCVIMGGYLDNVKCTVLAVDDEWIKLLVGAENGGGKNYPIVRHRGL